MKNEDQFDIILSVLGRVLLGLTARGVSDHAVVIGGQVVSIERISRGQPVFEMTSGSNERIILPFSKEPDILFDREGAAAQDGAIEEVLKSEGFQRASTWRWLANLSGVEIEIDVLESATLEGGAAIVPSAPMTFARARNVVVSAAGHNITLRVPDAASFFRLKLDARLGRAKPKSKDSFDMYAYARTVSVDEIRKSLSQAAEGPTVREALRDLFADVTAVGTIEVLKMIDQPLHEIVARDVVDAFAAIVSVTSALP